MDVIVRRCGKVWSDFVGKVLGGRERKRKERWLGEVLIFVCGNKGYGFTTGVGAVIENNFRFFCFSRRGSLFGNKVLSLSNFILAIINYGGEKKFHHLKEKKAYNKKLNFVQEKKNEIIY